jgi:hypothetical protein
VLSVDDSGSRQLRKVLLLGGEPLTRSSRPVWQPPHGRVNGRSAARGQGPGRGAEGEAVPRLLAAIYSSGLEVALEWADTAHR